MSKCELCQAFSAEDAKVDRVVAAIKQVAEHLRVEEVAAIFGRALEKIRTLLPLVSRAHQVTHLAAAAIFCGCREAGFPRTFSEVAGAADCSVKQLHRSVQALSKHLVYLPQLRPRDLVEKIGAPLGLDYPTILQAQRVADGLANHTQGRTQSTVAAAAIMLVGDAQQLDRLARVAQAAGISATTLKTVLRKLPEDATINLPTRKRGRIGSASATCIGQGLKRSRQI